MFYHCDLRDSGCMRPKTGYGKIIDSGGSNTVEDVFFQLFICVNKVDSCGI